MESDPPGRGVDPRVHWERTYSARPADRLGWHAPHLEVSLELIARSGIGPGARVIDVGGGASTLVDDLLERGFAELTVLDLSEQALATARRRLGSRGGGVSWVVADITRASLPRDRFDLWHDRAVFHFLTEPGDRDRYAACLGQALAPGGHAVIGTFAPEAPPRCSGLAVVRYDAPGLRGALGAGLELVEQRKSPHLTPGGVEQMYLYCLLRRPAHEG